MKDKLLNKLIEQHIIDVEILYSHLPKGDYLAQVNSDSFDEDLFLFYKPSDKPSEWVEVLVSTNNPESAYCVQGQVWFIHKSGEILKTHDSIVKHCNDVTFLRHLGEQSCLHSCLQLN